MTQDSASFVGQVSGVAPLDGRAIDGAPRPAPKRQRKPAREPMDRRRTFFCSNPQCDHETWAAPDQAVHMAKEFWWAAQALVKLAPESPEAVKLAGGVTIRDLTDDECLAANAEWFRDRRWGRQSSIKTRLGKNEFDRRRKQGILTPPQDRKPRPRHRDSHCRNGHLYTPGTTKVEDGKRRCLICRRETDRRRRSVA